MKTSTPNDEKLGTEDKKKLHDRINQCGNQRFVLTTAAVALFGVFTAGLLRGETPTPLDKAVLCRALLAAIVYSILLGTFYLQSLKIRNLLRTMTTYLLVKRESVWEEDWYSFRESRHQAPHAGHDSRAHSIAFLALSAIVFGAVAILCWYNQDLVLRDLQLEILAAVSLSSSATLAYSAVRNSSYKRELHVENDILRHWHQYFADKTGKEAGATRTHPQQGGELVRK